MMTATQDPTVLAESIRRHDESLEGHAGIEAHIVSEIARLDQEIAALEADVDEVPASTGGALARHDLRQRIIDSQLILEGHQHELLHLRSEIAHTKAAREEAVEALEKLRA
jgi:hypothetical protein